VLKIPALLITLGLLLLVIAYRRAGRLVDLLRDQGPWPSLRNLIAFFAVGYGVYLVFLVLERPFDRDLIAAEVFFLSAVFILLVVRFAYRTIREIMRLEEMEQLANTDELTGLFNRRAIMRLLEEEFWKAHRFGFPLSLAMIDLDRFKDVNDRWGHLAGDVVLREVAATLKERLRKIDVVGRYGGEEFLCILPSTPVDGALITGERVRGFVRDLRFRPTEPGGFERAGRSGSEAGAGEFVQVTVSVGVSTVNSAFRRPEDLLAAADAALYRAKGKGRDRTELYEDVPAAGT
jgi:diguanylate cyclase (GGDEF)-like protein